jgi:hypothetical protein
MAYETLWNSSAEEIVTLPDRCRLAAPRILGVDHPKPVTIIKGNNFRSLIKTGQEKVFEEQTPILLRFADGPGRPSERIMFQENSNPKSFRAKTNGIQASKANRTVPLRAGKDLAPPDGVSQLVSKPQDRCGTCQQNLVALNDQHDALQKMVSGLEREVTRIKDRIKYLGTLENKMAEIIDRTNENSRIAISARNTCRKVNGDPEDSSTFTPIQK